MKREIKFRGKLTIEPSIWIYGYLYQDKTGSYIKQSDKDMRFGCGLDVIPESVGQSTGLKDNEGLDIYEGDILRLDIGSADVLKIHWVVSFRLGAFVVTPRDEQGEDYLSFASYQDQLEERQHGDITK